MQKDQLFGVVVHRYLSKFVHKCIVVMPALNFLTNGFVDPDLMVCLVGDNGSWRVLAAQPVLIAQPRNMVAGCSGNFHDRGALGERSVGEL